MAPRALLSLWVSLVIPFSLNAAVVFRFGSGRMLDGIPNKPWWVPPLWLIHTASLGSALLMSIASWLVWARGQLRVDSDALPLYVAQVSLAAMWNPLVLVIGSCWSGSVLGLANFGTLVACKVSFEKATRLAGDIDGHGGDDQKQSTADMTAFVQNLLQQMVSGAHNLVICYFLSLSFGHNVKFAGFPMASVCSNQGSRPCLTPSSLRLMRWV
ncbi:hypothetical protein SAY87_000668 [Trapa incisa]|uniref:Uncharacterized protein n=1 Tax=Trapa incisa TaxID=236973 RepID=A0AAN7GNG5_9MYRT|nr:hypothetical protein SAY87_000668 [Trapa incisa]